MVGTMSIIVIGAHGKVARHALPLLAKMSDNLRGVIRNPDHAAEVEKLGATPVVEDVTKLDDEAWQRLLEGAHTVVWSAGAGGGDPERTYAVDRDAAIASIDNCPDSAHYIMVSYWGASRGDEIDENDSFYPYAISKKTADEHLRSTKLKHTILKPSMLTDNEAGDIRTGSEDETEPGSTSREAVALMIARHTAEGPAGDFCFVDD